MMYDSWKYSNILNSMKNMTLYDIGGEIVVTNWHAYIDVFLTIMCIIYM